MDDGVPLCVGIPTAHIFLKVMFWHLTCKASKWHLILEPCLPEVGAVLFKKETRHG